MRSARQADPKIVHIDIDEQSINRIGRWPWSREWHAGLITALSEYHAKVVSFDIFFCEPSPLIDFFMIEATRLAKNVIYAITFEFDENSGFELPEEQREVYSKFAISESQIIGNKRNIPKLSRPAPIVTDLYKEALTAGHVITIPDPDGSIRRAPSVISCRGSYYLHFGIRSALAYLGIDASKIKIILGKYIDLGNGTRIPIDDKGLIIINWAGAWGKGFKHYAFWDVIASYQQVAKGENPIIKMEEFKDKLCIIGLTATGLIDIKPMPLQNAYPIVGLHTNIVDAIIQNKFVREADPPINLLLILFLSALTGILVPRFRPLVSAVFLLLLVMLYFGITYLIFKFTGLWISIAYPLTGVFITFVSVTIHSEIANAIERIRLFHLAVEDGLTKLYVVRHFKEMLDQEMSKAKRYNRPLSLIISDIDHFKRVNDTYGHLSGDFILREVANIFKSSCRETDIPGRYGGEEFVILLPETKLEGAIEFAERLRKLVESLTLEYDNVKFNITISFGVAEYKNEATNADFIKRADEALYVAKETGRNKVCFG
jgi:diguanylate cyclase (GGDEF)-like protein